MITRFRSEARSVGVIAVDPSSRRSGGALLGDRVRLVTDPEDPLIFVRSMAARDRLGGLADDTIAAMVLMRALYEVVLVETVGVGQSETDVAGVADTVVFCVQPASGDSLQFMKAGIVEIPHVAVVTKADMGASAKRALADLRGALSLAQNCAADDWPVEVLAVSASNGLGMDALHEALKRRAAWLSRNNRLTAQRRTQAEAWLRESLRDRFGRDGLKRALSQNLLLSMRDMGSPFGHLAEVSRQLSAE